VKEEKLHSQKFSKGEVKGQFTRSANKGGPSPNAAAKALMGGLKECVGMLMEDMKEDREQRSKLENRRLDLLFARIAAQNPTQGPQDSAP
jgi:hypothetical protein